MLLSGLYDLKPLGHLPIGRLLGLDAKLAQYIRGKAFVDAVVEAYLVEAGRWADQQAQGQLDRLRGTETGARPGHDGDAGYRGCLLGSGQEAGAAEALPLGQLERVVFEVLPDA